MRLPISRQSRPSSNRTWRRWSASWRPSTGFSRGGAGRAGSLAGPSERQGGLKFLLSGYWMVMVAGARAWDDRARAKDLAPRAHCLSTASRDRPRVTICLRCANGSWLPGEMKPTRGPPFAHALPPFLPLLPLLFPRRHEFFSDGHPESALPSPPRATTPRGSAEPATPEHAPSPAHSASFPAALA